MVNPRKPQATINVDPGAPGFLGCSALAQAIGVSDYRTPLQCFNVFMGKPEEITPEQAIIFQRGHLAEDFISKEIENEYGYRLRKVNVAYVHPKYNWWVCHPDRLLVGKVEGKRIGVEIKSSSTFVNSRWGDPDTDDIPIDYYMQCLGYMACGVCDEVHLFRCSNWKLTRYVVKYDQQRIDRLDEEVSKEVEKWLRGEAPSPSNVKEAYQVWHDPDGDMVADQSMITLCKMRDKLKAEKKNLDEELDKVNTEIINHLAGKSRLVTDDGKKLLTYTRQKKTTIDSKALKEEQPEVFAKYSNTTEYTVLR